MFCTTIILTIPAIHTFLSFEHFVATILFLRYMHTALCGIIVLGDLLYFTVFKHL